MSFSAEERFLFFGQNNTKFLKFGYLHLGSVKCRIIFFHGEKAKNWFVIIQINYEVIQANNIKFVYI